MNSLWQIDNSINYFKESFISVNTFYFKQINLLKNHQVPSLRHILQCRRKEKKVEKIH